MTQTMNTDIAYLNSIYRHKNDFFIRPTLVRNSCVYV